MTVSELKGRLEELSSDKITLITKGRKQKEIRKKGTISNISDYLFCIDVPIGREHVETKSFRYHELLSGKIEIVELSLD